MNPPGPVWSRRGLLAAAAAFPLASWAGRRGLWDEPADHGRLVVFAQDGGTGPGVRPAALRALVQRGAPATVGLIAAFGLRVMAATERKPAAFGTAAAMLLQPCKVLVFDGQLLVPTLDETLRAFLKVEVLAESEVAGSVYAEVAGGARVEGTVLLADAHRIAALAVQNGEEGVLKQLGLAQLVAWRSAPPFGMVPAAG